MKKHSSKILILAAAILCFLFWHNWRQASPRKLAGDIMQEGRSIKILCDLWAEGHDGKYPLVLSEIITDNHEGITESDLQKWDYTAQLTNTDNGDLVILSFKNHQALPNTSIKVRVNSSVKLERLN